MRWTPSQWFASSLPFAGALLLLAMPGLAKGGDWVHWRGPEQNGVSRERDLPEHWSPKSEDKDNNLVWKAPFGCRSTPVIMNGRVYIINEAGAGITTQERAMCFDANSGKVLWEKRFNVFHTDMVNSRLGWTNLAGDPQTGNVYAHGTQGFLTCFDRDGKELWTRSLTEEYGRVTGYGGRIVSPIVDEDLVIIGMINSSWGDQARGGNRFAAFDKKTGTPVWWMEPGGPMKGTYYSNPVVAVMNGQRLLITGGADGAVHAMKVRTGEKVWSYTFSLGVVNASPVVDGNLVYITHGEENPDVPVRGRVICLDGSKVKDGQPQLVWENKDGVLAGYASPIIDAGRLYVCDDTARMFCFDAKTGKPVWRRPYKYGRLARGSGVLADGKIYIAEVNSHFHILKPDAKGCEELHDQFFPSPISGAFVELNGSPAVADGRVYLSTRDELFCIGKKDRKAEAVKAPPLPQEAPADPKAKPAHLQLIPADTVLYPGDSTTFKVRTFDANGRLLGETKAEFGLPAPTPPPGAKTSPPALRGTIADGKLTVDANMPGQQGFVEAKAQGLTGRARVRVVPRLPYSQDFEKAPIGAVPGGWNNVQGKFVIEKRGDSVVLKKLANDSRPPLAKANAYLGLPDLKDYMMECDVMATKVRDNMPDLGLVASRYTLMLGGNKQELRIVSWEAQPRIDETMEWKWQPETWYRLKIVVEQNGDKATVRGKAWKRDQPEPKEWTIQVTDPIPNREGSPAVYAYSFGIQDDSPGAESFFDNLKVTPIKK